MLLPAFSPPGYLDDFSPLMLTQWSAAVSGWVDENIALAQSKVARGDQVQFYNETKVDVGPPIDQVIGWNALPGTFRNRWGREMALDLAEQILPLTRRMDGPGEYFAGDLWNGLFYRPQDEYCEWHVTRNDQGQITRVTFTSEPPEYWQAMHGDELPDMSGNATYPFAGDQTLLLELYREYVSPEVQLADLECSDDFIDYSDPTNPITIYPKGSYNPYNRWNTTGGIMHLTHPANSLSAEINLGVLATVLRTSYGRPVIDPEALISCAAYGGLSRASDPTIGSTVNELAALGAHVTLRNPVGLAMHHLDLAGFSTPHGEPVDASFFQVLRGNQELGLIERAIFEVPAGEGFTVSDCTIGGIPITRGSQIAEHMVVNIVGRASGLGTFGNIPMSCSAASWQDDQQANWLVYGQGQQTSSPVSQQAFAYPPATPAADYVPLRTISTNIEESATPEAAHSVARHRTRGI